MSATVLASHILFSIALFALSLVVTYLVLRLRILDEPNHRSSHQRPTPSTGGIAIFVAFAIGFSIVWFYSDQARLSTSHLIGFAVAASLIAIVGLLDDLGKLKTFKAKLAVQIAAAMILLAFGIALSNISIPIVGAVSLGWLGYPLTVLWVVAMTNIFNFMES